LDSMGEHIGNFAVTELSQHSHNGWGKVIIFQGITWCLIHTSEVNMNDRDSK